MTMRTNTIALIVSAINLVAFTNNAGAQPDTVRLLPTINPGAVELNFSASVLDVEGSSSVSAALRGGIFFSAPSGLGALELEASYSHISSLDMLDMQFYAS